MGVVEQKFDHTKESIFEAVGVSNKDCQELGKKAFSCDTISEMVEVVYKSDESEATKLFTCFLLGGFMEKRKTVSSLVSKLMGGDE